MRFHAALFVILMAPQVGGQTSLPSHPLVIRDFTLQFEPSGTFSLSGQGWPSMAGTWKADGGAVTLLAEKAPKGCADAGRYKFSLDGQRVSFALVSDECVPRRMILDRSEWLPKGVAVPIPKRTITRTEGSARGSLPAAAPGA